MSETLNGAERSRLILRRGTAEEFAAMDLVGLTRAVAHRCRHKIEPKVIDQDHTARDGDGTAIVDMGVDEATRWHIYLPLALRNVP